MEQKYIDLFSWVDTILERQKKQKTRGLNNYNIVNIVRKATHEVGMHSNVIYSFINPNGAHYQNDLFLNKFLEKVILPKLSIDNIKDFGTVYAVEAEEATDKKRRIDFTIKSDKYFIGIEMKVNASDLQNQISDYYDYLVKMSEGQKVYIFYLTKYGSNPSPKSVKNIQDENNVKKISFAEDIMNWITASQHEVRNIMNLNMALENYRQIVEKITNKYKGNVVNIRDELLEEGNKEKLKAALAIDKDMAYIKGKLLFNFFEKLSTILKDKGFIESDTLDDYPARYADELTCRNFFEKSSSRPRFFGKTYKLKNGKDLFICIAIKSLCHGVLDQSSLGKDFKKEHLSNDKFKDFISSYKCDKTYRNIMNKMDKLIHEDNFFKLIESYIEEIDN